MTLMPVAEAQARLLSLAPLLPVEIVALGDAAGRWLAEDVRALRAQPWADLSAMDGYALRGEDLSADAPARLRVIDTVYAGRTSSAVPGPGECVRIMTGGVMPAGCDSVVPQEFVKNASETQITLPAGVVKAGDNRRLAGEDLAAGKPALAKGRTLVPADLGLLASLGIAEVPVNRKLRVAFFSTGDELRSIGEPLDEGCVYDSNRYTLHGMLTRLGCELIDISNNIGDAKSLICHPATTTHHNMGAEGRAAAGVGEGMLRLNVGLEDPQDLIEDLAQAFDRAGV